jgi:hypothetical protein
MSELADELDKMKICNHNISSKNNKPNLKYTQACRHVLETGTCTHNGCTYAHYKEQLRVPECCFVKCRNYNFNNPCLSTCMRHHTSHETLEEFKLRVNYVEPDLPSMPDRMIIKGDDENDDSVVIDLTTNSSQNVSSILPPIQSDNDWEENITLVFKRSNMEMVGPLVTAAVHSGRSSVMIKIIDD